MRLIPGEPLTIELAEWEPPATLPDLRLTEADRQLAATLAGGEGRLVVEELRDGVRIRATSWIGVVRFEGFEVRVVPKLVGGNLGVIEMVDYASGLDALARYRAVRTMSVERQGRLVDLVGLLLAEACEQLTREGLLQDYVTREEVLGTLRGRLLVAEQVERQYGRIDQLACRFDELETDILENQLLSVGLGLARRVCRDDEVVRRIARVHGVFNDACTASEFEPERAAHELTYHRRNNHYKTAHELAWYFVRRLAVTDLFAPGRGRCFAFLLDMNVLFERFVTRFLEELFAGTEVRVLAQRRDRSLIFNEATGRPHAAVIPDILLMRRDALGRQQVPVDAKYKLYDERKLDPADLYQVFFYAYAYARPADRDAGRSQAFIVYPATAGSGGLRLRIQAQGGVTSARVRAVPFDIEAALASIRLGHVNAAGDLEPIRRALAEPPQPTLALN